MADEKVTIDIETALKNEVKLDKFVAQIRALENIDTKRLEDFDRRITQVGKSLNVAADAAERFNQQSRSFASGTGGINAQANAAARAALAQERLAQAQGRVQVSAQNLANAQQRAQNSAQNAATGAGRAQVAAQNLANAQVRAQVSTQNLATAQGRAQVAAQQLANAQARVAAQTAALNAQFQTSSITNFSRQLSSAQRDLNQIGQSIRGLGTTLSFSLTAPIAAVGAGVLTAAIRMDGLKRALNTVTGSAQETEIQLARLRKIAELPGIGFEEAIRGSIRLQNVGFSAQTAERAIKAFGNAVALTGGGAVELDRINYQLAQLASKGKVLTQDLRPIIDAAPAVAKALRQAFGSVDPQQIQALGLSTEEFLDKLFTSLENLNKADVNAVSNQLENLRTAVFIAASTVGNVLLPIFVRFIQTIQPLLERFANAFAALSPQIQNLILAGVALLAVLGPILIIVGSLITSIGSIITFGGAIVGFLGTIGSAVVSIAGVLGSLIAALGSGGLLGLLGSIGGLLSGAVGTAITAFLASISEILIAVVAIGVAVTALAAVVAGAVTIIYQVWQRNIGGIQEIALNVFNAIKNAGIGAVNLIKSEWNKTLPFLRQLVENILSGIQAFWNTWGSTIVTIVSTAWNALKVIVANGISIIGGAIRIFLAVLNGDWAKAWEELKVIVQKLYESIFTFLGAAAKIMLELVKSAFFGLLKLIGFILKIGYELAKSWITGIINAIIAAPAAIANAIKYLFTQAVFDVSNFIYEKGKLLWTYLKNGFTAGAQQNPITIPAPQEAGAQQPGAPPPTNKPNDFGKPVTKTPKQARDLIRPLDQAARAQEEAFLKLNEDTNKRLLDQNEFSYRQNLIGFRQYLDSKTALNVANINLQIESEKTALERLTSERQKLNERLARTGNKGERQAIQREIDNLTGEVVKTTTQITLLERARNDQFIKGAQEAEAFAKDAGRAAQETTQRFLELTNQKLKAAQIGVSLEFDEKQRALANDLKAATDAQNKARAAGNQGLVNQIQKEIDRLNVEISQTEEIRKQILLQAEFADNQEKINQIEFERSLALDRLNRELERTGATDDEATRRRRELMQQYQQQIDKVVQSLKALQARGFVSPELQKLIDSLNNQGANVSNVTLEDRIKPIRDQIDRIKADRDLALSQLSVNGETDLANERTRVQILEEANNKIRQQLELWRQIESTRSGGPSNDFKQAAADANNATQEVINFQRSLKNTTIGAGLGAIVGFFDDVASGAKSFKDAALDALGAFVGAIQRVIVTLLALYAISAVTGIPVQVLANFLGLGGSVGGKRDGGPVAQIPKFADGGASSLRINPVGYIAGPGTGRSDSIRSYFPGSRTVADISATEFVIPADVTQNIGVQRLNYLLSTRGKGFASMFDYMMQGKAYGFADGGATNLSDSVVNVQAPQVNTGETNLNMQQLNYIGRKSIEQVISDFQLGQDGQKVFINQVDENIDILKAKLGLRS